ncbi:MAG: hypothetical protein ACYC8T_31285 [Myxococcaceae bacterium]
MNMVAFALVALVALSGAPKKTQLKLEVNPDAAVVYVDGKKKGTGAKDITLTLTPGKHLLKVTHKGDEHQEQVVVKKGEVRTWQWAFEDDRMDRKKPPPEEGEGEGGGETEAPSP